MTHVGAFMLTWKNAFAFLSTTTVEKLPVTRFLNPDLPSMVAALERELIPDSSRLARSHWVPTVLEHNVNDISPCATLACKQLRIPEDVEAPLGSGERNTGTILRGEKADRMALV